MSSRFSKETLQFLLKASRQKNPNWLEKNRPSYEQALLNPLRELAANLKEELHSLAPGYHFPQKGIGRIRRSQRSASEKGLLYKNWMVYSASRPNPSRFEGNPNLFFMINPEDKDDPVLVAGGLYMPSSRQLRAIREAIATDATPFDRLFASKEFKKHFKEGFSSERSSSRPPRGFDREHPRMDWLKLQAFFVWHPYTLREFSSKKFPAIVAKDWKQVLRLNVLLDQAITGKWAHAPVRAKKPRKGESHVSDLLKDLTEFRPKEDF